jgi:hypothetical protein
MRTRIAISLLALACSLGAQSLLTPWSGYGHDPQHSGLSANAAQPMNRIHWCTPVDTVLEDTSGALYIHYGSPVVTAANTVLVPQRTSSGNTYRINAFSGGSGGSFKCGSPNTPLYTLNTDYTPPAHDWIPSYGGTLALGIKYYYPGAGGTVYYRTSPDSATGTTGQLAFYGLSLYQANSATFNSSVQISTPITADRFGTIYFGFVVSGSNPAGLISGVARISATGAGSWVSAAALAGGDVSVAITQVQMNCGPALSLTQTTLYIGVTSGNMTPGYLAAVNASTLAPIAHAHLIDPNTGQNASIFDDSSGAPTVGPDGDVYYGVFETACCSNHDRGWLLHFNSTLSTSKLPGAFGWDTTASVVPKAIVPGYQGSSTYLLLTKYNDYKSTGGAGQNYVAITDPNTSMIDPITGVNVMNVVMKQIGLTPDGALINGVQPVREWCINSAAIDPVTKSAIVNSEDGTNYRWDFTTNTLSQLMSLSPGVGEAYTPTVIGPDGTVYAINDAVLYAIGQ